MCNVVPFVSLNVSPELATELLPQILNHKPKPDPGPKPDPASTSLLALDDPFTVTAAEPMQIVSFDGKWVPTSGLSKSISVTLAEPPKLEGRGYTIGYLAAEGKGGWNKIVPIYVALIRVGNGWKWQAVTRAGKVQKRDQGKVFRSVAGRWEITATWSSGVVEVSCRRGSEIHELAVRLDDAPEVIDIPLALQLGNPADEPGGDDPLWEGCVFHDATVETYEAPPAALLDQLMGVEQQRLGRRNVSGLPEVECSQFRRAFEDADPWSPKPWQPSTPTERTRRSWKTVHAIGIRQCGMRFAWTPADIDRIYGSPEFPAVVFAGAPYEPVNEGLPAIAIWEMGHLAEPFITAAVRVSKGFVQVDDQERYATELIQRELDQAASKGTLASHPIYKAVTG